MKSSDSISWTSSILMGCVSLFGLLIASLGMWLFISQVLGYLDKGIWQSMTLVDYFGTFNALEEWSAHPVRGKGIHKIFSSINASLGLIISGIGLNIWVLYIGYKKGYVVI